MSTGAIIGLCLGLGIPGGLIIGLIIGFFVSQKYFKKQMNDNPPVSKEAIRAMYRQMGRTPTEAQLNQTMEAFKRNNNPKKNN